MACELRGFALPFIYHEKSTRPCLESSIFSSLSGLSRRTRIMLRRLVPLVAAFVIALSGGSLAASELALLSRTLIQGPARSVAFSGAGVIVGTGCGIAIFRNGDALRNPAYIPLEGEPGDIVVRGSLAYVAASSGGLVVLDISGPGAPKQTFRYGAIQAERCALAGGTLFVADAQSRLFLFDCADPR
jgi:hypothetical protein